MEDLQVQLDGTRSELERTRSELVCACARLRGTEVLARNVEDLRRENDVLREQLLRYEDALLSVENRLETLGSFHGAENAPAADMPRPVAFSSLLEENQRLSSIIEMYERLPGQQQHQGMNFGVLSEARVAMEEKIEELQSENDFLRDECEQAQSALKMTRIGGGSSVGALEERLERSDRVVATKTRLCEMLAEEVQKLNLKLRSRDESTVGCAGVQCQHLGQVEQLNQLVAKQHQEMENLNHQRQEDNGNFARMREEYELRLAEQQNHIQESMTQAKLIEEKNAAEKQETNSKMRQMQNLVAQLNENCRQMQRGHKQLNIQLTQTQYKMQQMTADRDTLRQNLNQQKDREVAQSNQMVQLSDKNAELYRQLQLLKDNKYVPMTMSTKGQFSLAGYDSRTADSLAGYDSRAAGLVSRGPQSDSQPISSPQRQLVQADGVGGNGVLPFVKPDPSHQASGPAPMQQGVERQCPVCKQTFTMEITAFYKHCDMCAEKQG